MQKKLSIVQLITKRKKYLLSAQSIEKRFIGFSLFFFVVVKKSAKEIENSLAGYQKKKSSA